MGIMAVVAVQAGNIVFAHQSTCELEVWFRLRQYSDLSSWKLSDRL